MLALESVALNPRAFTAKDLADRIQYTNIRPNATEADIRAHLEVCARYGFNAAMVQMCWVPLAREFLRGTGVKVATCISVGMGGDSARAKAAAIRECVALGADEVDYMPNIGFFLSGMYDAFRDEAAALVEAADGRPIKAMLEFGFLKTEDERRLAARLSDEAGVAWVKQSSGWGEGGIQATVEDVRLLRETVSPRCRVKVSGKVNTYEKAIAMFEAGAELIGTSGGPQIVERTDGAPSYY